ncbi:hypothetical protein GH733_007444 [Mirounga leonina]|nr:hypothetical protein GH733_007444 [Mirounga leonina]
MAPRDLPTGSARNLMENCVGVYGIDRPVEKQQLETRAPEEEMRLAPRIKTRCMDTFGPEEIGSDEKSCFLKHITKVAICKPLLYTVVMSRSLCTWLIVLSYIGEVKSHGAAGQGLGLVMASPSRRLQTKPVITCFKSVLLIYTFIFWITGVILLAVGIWGKALC